MYLSTRRHITLVYFQNPTGAPIVVTQFQILDWPADGRVTQPDTIIQVIENVIKVQQSTGGGPVVVHCRYTYY